MSFPFFRDEFTPSKEDGSVTAVSWRGCCLAESMARYHPLPELYIHEVLPNYDYEAALQQTLRYHGSAAKARLTYISLNVKPVLASTSLSFPTRQRRISGGFQLKGGSLPSPIFGHGIGGVYRGIETSITPKYGGWRRRNRCI